MCVGWRVLCSVYTAWKLFKCLQIELPKLAMLTAHMWFTRASHFVHPQILPPQLSGIRSFNWFSLHIQKAYAMPASSFFFFFYLHLDWQKWCNDSILLLDDPRYTHARIRWNDGRHILQWISNQIFKRLYSSSAMGLMGLGEKRKRNQRRITIVCSDETFRLPCRKPETFFPSQSFPFWRQNILSA